MLGKSLLDILYSPNTPENTTNTDSELFIATFALQVALGELWKAWGITPTVVMGTSIGEYAAAYAAGLFSLEDALKMVISGQGHLQSENLGG